MGREEQQEWRDSFRESREFLLGMFKDLRENFHRRLKEGFLLLLKRTSYCPPRRRLRDSMCFTHPLQLEAEGLIPAQPVGGGPARPANRSAVQAQHGTNFH